MKTILTFILAALTLLMSGPAAATTTWVSGWLLPQVGEQRSSWGWGCAGRPCGAGSGLSWFPRSAWELRLDALRPLSQQYGKRSLQNKTDRQPHFITCTVVDWLPIFTQPKAVDIVFGSLRHLQSNDGLILFGFVIMENHAHLIVSSDHLSHVIARFKSYTARKIIDFLLEGNEMSILQQLKHAKLRNKTDREFQFWQEGSHPVQIQSRDMMLQRLRYMHNNPVRRGYVDDPTHWRYSSARNYSGGEGLLEVRKSW